MMLRHATRLSTVGRLGLFHNIQHKPFIKSSFATFSTTSVNMSYVKVHVANVDDLQDGQMKEVQVHGAKILLSRVMGKFYATSNRCTHYGGPLAKGVLSKDGRLTCPWHGACFRVDTGDIEDIMGPNALQTFGVTVEDGKVLVCGETEAFKQNQHTPLPHPRTITDKSLALIIGGGAGGFSAAQSIREYGYQGRVRIISQEPYLPIDRPKLSKAKEIDVSAFALRDAEELKAAGIEIDLDTTVTRVDPIKQTVTLASGETLEYSHLVLAVGSKPRTLPFIDDSLPHVYYLRHADQADAIRKAVAKFKDRRPNVVVIGSSFIGMEMASVLASSAKVTVVAIEKVPYERILGLKVGHAIKTLFETKGVTFIPEAKIECVGHAVERKADEPMITVALQNHPNLQADVVVVGAGVRPATDFLKDTFQLEKDGSLKVDAYMRVSGYDNIYAVGDIATFPCDSQANIPIRVEHWSVGLNTGRCAGKRIAGHAEPYITVPFFWTAMFGKSLRYTGHATTTDDVVIQGDLKELSFAAFYLNGSRVEAVATINKDPVAIHVKELFRLGRMPSADQIRDGLDVLTIDV